MGAGDENTIEKDNTGLDYREKEKLRKYRKKFPLFSGSLLHSRKAPSLSTEQLEEYQMLLWRTMVGKAWEKSGKPLPQCFYNTFSLSTKAEFVNALEAEFNKLKNNISDPHKTQLEALFTIGKKAPESKLEHWNLLRATAGLKQFELKEKKMRYLIRRDLDTWKKEEVKHYFQKEIIDKQVEIVVDKINSNEKTLPLLKAAWGEALLNTLMPKQLNPQDLSKLVDEGFANAPKEKSSSKEKITIDVEKVTNFVLTQYWASQEKKNLKNTLSNQKQRLRLLIENATKAELEAFPIRPLAKELHKQEIARLNKNLESAPLWQEASELSPLNDLYKEVHNEFHNEVYDTNNLPRNITPGYLKTEYENTTGLDYREKEKLEEYKKQEFSTLSEDNKVRYGELLWREEVGLAWKALGEEPPKSLYKLTRPAGTVDTDAIAQEIAPLLLQLSKTRPPKDSMPFNTLIGLLLLDKEDKKEWVTSIQTIEKDVPQVDNAVAELEKMAVEHAKIGSEKLQQVPTQEHQDKQTPASSSEIPPSTLLGSEKTPTASFSKLSLEDRKLHETVKRNQFAKAKRKALKLNDLSPLEKAKRTASSEKESKKRNARDIITDHYIKRRLGNKRLSTSKVNEMQAQVTQALKEIDTNGLLSNSPGSWIEGLLSKREQALEKNNVKEDLKSFYDECQKAHKYSISQKKQALETAKKWHLGKKFRETTKYLKDRIYTIPQDRNKKEESDEKLKEEAEKAFKRLYGNLYDEHYETLRDKEDKEKKKEMALHKEVQLKWLIADILELKEGKTSVWKAKKAKAEECEKKLGVRR